MIDPLVIIGASGDLTARLLLPAVAELVEQKKAPDGLTLTGVDRMDWTEEQFRERMREALDSHATRASPQTRAEVLRRLRYRRADATRAEDLRRALSGFQQPVLAYLALPAHLFEPVLESLSQASLPEGSVVAVEKPFGVDLTSARRLNELLRLRFPSTLVFRIDHFLSDELVQRIIALRFGNRVLESIWNQQHIERVVITWDETLTVEGRAAYYDRAGALRDMIQNHLLEVLALVAMEQPSRFDERSIRDARAAVLRAIPTMSMDQVRQRSVRGRYAQGLIAGTQVPAYARERGVEASRETETFAELALEVASWRWAGVPFVLRTGKALSRPHAEVAVYFRFEPDHELRNPKGGQNVLRIGLSEPYVRLAVNINGPERTLVTTDLELRSHAAGRLAYSNLLLDMLRAEPMLTLRDDEVEEAWRIVGPVLEGWRKGIVPLWEYPAGSAGPSAP
ncbi:glucose-6-phosphate dehydrogenase [Myxococcus fulvus]|uniref:glucose-6-phosphate dehydrogenase n=1 Tax=Myxococcus fulvus TaxID=33 RepID=UPI003B99BB51